MNVEANTFVFNSNQQSRPKFRGGGGGGGGCWRKETVAAGTPS